MHQLRVSLLLVLLAGPAFGQTRYKMELEEKQTVSATLVNSTSFQNFEAKEWIAFLAVAPELPGQRKVKTTFEFPSATTTKEKSALERSVLIARVPAKTEALKTGIAMKAVYTATLYSRHLTVLGEADAPTVPPLKPAERKAALTEAGDVDFRSDSFQKWLKEQGYQRRKAEGDLPFARRVFLGLRGSLGYEFKVGMDRKASAVLEAGKSDCGGMSTLFVAVLRANEIPARTLYGRWAISAKANEKVSDLDYYQWHVRAEFYAADVGWVPVDLAASVLFDKSREGLRNFGHDHGDFLTMHVDANFRLDTGTFGVKSHHNLQDPTFWVAGTGKLDRRTDQESWTVEVKK